MAKQHKQSIKEKLQNHLEFIYKDRYNNDLLEKTQQLIEKYAAKVPQKEQKWSHEDSILITYGDSVVDKDEKPLKTLERFLTDYIKETISTVHILPFFPYSSDDGFSVIDYYAVRGDLGGWEDIEHLGQKYDLMADLVLNHISVKSEWFQNFLENKSPPFWARHAVTVCT